jgi:hypothetical protein
MSEACSNRCFMKYSRLFSLRMNRKEIKEGKNIYRKGLKLKC